MKDHCAILDAPTPVTPPRTAESHNVLTLTQADARALVARLGWPSYRATQLLRWLYRHRVRDVADMTDFSRSERSQLASIAHVGRFDQVQWITSSDGSRKMVITLEDGAQIEAVLIPDGDRLTLCLSSQVGCTLDCGFCLTGTMGLKRNLKAHEIVDQILTVQDQLEPGETLTNLVFMGMGEPLANLDAVLEAIARVTNPTWGLGLSPRRITVSTAGLASRLRDLAVSGVNLAVSLNATTEAQRARLMPTATRLHSLEELLDACRSFPLPAHRRLTFEYVLLAGVNDGTEDAMRLARLLRGLRCKVNLIPFNAFAGSPYRRPEDAVVHRFQAVLRQAGRDVFIRKSKGRDVLGACGQLGTPSASSSLVIPSSVDR